MNVAENIKHLLNQRGWSPERLAVESQELGEPLTVPAIRQWLSGRNTPSGQNVVILARCFGVSTDCILLGTQDTTPLSIRAKSLRDAGE